MVFCYMYIVLHVCTSYLLIHMLVTLGEHSDHSMRPSRTCDILPRVEWSAVTTTTLQVLQ